MDPLGAMQMPVPPLDLASAGAPARPADAATIDRVATSFESMFASLLVKQMRQTLDEGGLFGQDTSDIQGGLFDLYLGQHMAQAGGLGIAAMIKRQLQHAPVK